MMGGSSSASASASPPGGIFPLPAAAAPSPGGERRNKAITKKRRRTHKSTVFQVFVFVSTCVGLGNILYHELLHDENVAHLAEAAFRAAHFRTDLGSWGSSSSSSSSTGSKAVGGANAAGGGETSRSEAAGGSDLAGLRCDDHGGPSDPSEVQEMVYWSDIPRDSDWVSPFHPSRAVGAGEEEKYLTFEPDHGGWNNIRMAMESVLVLAAAMGRTLVLPPEKPMYLLKKQGQKNVFTFNDFFHLDAVAAEHAGVSVISMEEFLKRKKGKLFDHDTREVKQLPHDRVDWNGRDLKELWAYLRTVGVVPRWDPKKCVAAIPASPDPKDAEDLKKVIADIMSEKYGPKPKFDDFTGKPTPVNGTVIARLGEALGERTEICLYDAELQAAPVLHMMVDAKTKARLLTHFYTFIFFQDWRHDLWAKRFVRDHIRYVDEIVCAAARVVNAVRERARKRDEANNPKGEFDSAHVRRGDFQYKKMKVDAETLYSNSKDEFTEGSTLYIATDERNKAFFEPLTKHYDVCYLDDFEHLIKGINTNYYGMLDQLVASKGRVFFGTFFSTLTGYVNRMRGYYNAKHQLEGYKDGTIQSYYFVPNDRKFNMRQYRAVKLPLYMQEFPSSWRDIDMGIDEHGTLR